MPQAAKLTEEEKDEIAIIAAKLKAEKPNTTVTEIGHLVGRSKQSISKVMDEERFQFYRNQYKKKIDQTRMKIMELADKQLLKATKQGKIKPYQLIGMSKTFHEQTWPVMQPGINVQGQQMAVQVIRGNVSYNSDKEEKPET